jgi:hypothetical protein
MPVCLWDVRRTFGLWTVHWLRIVELRLFRGEVLSELAIELLAIILEIDDLLAAARWVCVCAG